MYFLIAIILLAFVEIFYIKHLEKEYYKKIESGER